MASYIHRGAQKACKTVGFLAVACVVMAGMLAIVGCGMDSVQLGECIRKEMQAELVKRDGLKSLKMKEVRLLRDEGVNYSGIGKGEIDGRTIKFKVKCKYDGRTVIWDASPAEDSLFALATKEKAQEMLRSLKEGLRKTYESASKMAGECRESVSKKASRSAGAAREKPSPASKTAEKCADAAKEKPSSE